jgi:DNA repair protein RadC
MAMPHQSQAERFARLQRILAVLLEQHKFTLERALQSLPQENPRMVARLVRDLESEGHLRVVEDETYCWTRAPRDLPARNWLEKKVYTAHLPQTPAADRPRERLLIHGVAALRTAELLAILIRSGRIGESTSRPAKKLPRAMLTALGVSLRLGKGS